MNTDTGVGGSRDVFSDYLPGSAAGQLLVYLRGGGGRLLVQVWFLSVHYFTVAVLGVVK